MRNKMSLAAVAAATLLGACVGGIEPMPTPGGDDGVDPPPTSGTAREIFDADVKPLLTLRCASCHVGPNTSPTNMFLGPDGESSYYTALENDRAVVGGWVATSATLLTKGVHLGPAWTSAEAAKVTAWLDAELQERDIPTDPGPTDPGTPSNTSARGASMAFAACLSVSQAEFTATQAYQVANLNSENGRCYSCHEPGGAGGAYLGRANNYLDMFNKWQEELFFIGVFQPQIQAGSPPTYKIAAAESKICNKGKEKENNLGTHPAFNCQQNGGVALNNLKTFIQQVETKLNTPGACPTPGFKPPATI
jgi:cytochrome c553